MADTLSKDLDINVWDDLGDNLSEPKPTTQSTFTSMQRMMDEQWEMLNNAIQQSNQQCAHDAELMEANWEYRRESIGPEATNKKIFAMGHPEQYCGRTVQIDNFPNMLRSKIQSHMHQILCGDPDKVKYTVSLLSTLNNHPDLAQRQTQMTNPVSGFETYGETQIPV